MTYQHYEGDEGDDVREDPYSCPKSSDYEKALERADWQRTEMKDRECEAAWAASQEKKGKA